MNIYEVITNFFGTLGVILVQVYYFLLQANKCKSDDLSFLIGNSFGSIFLLISLWFSWNLYAVIIELTWFLISLYGLWKLWRRRFS